MAADAAPRTAKVFEAVPQKLLPPSCEPTLRVGVILEEDAKRVITFACPAPAVLAGADGKKVTLEGARAYAVELAGDVWVLRQDGVEILRSGGVFVVSLEHEPEIAPGAGIRVDGIVAGRGFHWQKEISQTLPGTLEFIPTGDRFVLVNTVGLEFYTTCVLASEMSGRDCPIEFGKAQATAARSWAYVFLGNKYPGKPYQICNDDFSQRYQGTTHLSSHAIVTVKRCRGDYLVLPDGAVCPAYYAKSCGGHAETTENLFAVDSGHPEGCFDAADSSAVRLDLSNDGEFAKFLDLEGLRREQFFCGSVAEEDLPRYLGAVDEKGSYFRWTHTTDAKTIIRKLKERCGLEDVRAIREVRPGRRGVSGRFLTVTIVYVDCDEQLQEFVLGDQFYVRACLHPSFLFSSAFVMTVDRDAQGDISALHFRGAGWGHGGGLCQIGALGMGLQGLSYARILEQYYPNARVVRAY